MHACGSRCAGNTSKGAIGSRQVLAFWHSGDQGPEIYKPGQEKEAKVVTVPSGAVTGSITVTSPAGTAASTASFTVTSSSRILPKVDTRIRNESDGPLMFSFRKLSVDSEPWPPELAEQVEIAGIEGASAKYRPPPLRESAPVSSSAFSPALIKEHLRDTLALGHSGVNS
jgi:hypothetical protein